MNPYSEIQTEFRPRVIVWALASGDDLNGFVTRECMLTIDSIARLAKPIIVFTGSNLLRRSDLFEIIEYGTALGMKIIVEVQPEEIRSDVLYRYAAFGPKLFRLVVDGGIVEDPNTRYKQSPKFFALQEAVRLLKASGYEIHLGTTIDHVDIRELAYQHDFAFRSAANGLYCHLSIEDSDPREEQNMHEVIEAIARMKRVSPEQMYVSPQCVRYGQCVMPDTADIGRDRASAYSGEWSHQCLGGKSFAFIDAEGNVRVCSGMNQGCSNLRSMSYDFKHMWEISEEFQILRSRQRTCAETRTELVAIQETQSSERE